MNLLAPEKIALMIVLFIVGFFYVPLAGFLIEGIDVAYEPVWAIIVVGLFFSLINMFLKPLILTMPEITVVWRQVLVFVLSILINMLLLWFVALLADILTIEQFLPLLYGTLLIGILSAILSVLYELASNALEAVLLGAIGAGGAYALSAAILGAFDGIDAEVVFGISGGISAVAGINGIISGATEIYDWRSPTGWIAFISSSSWGIIGTLIGVLLHTVNLFYGSGRNYDAEKSKRQNRNVYNGGFGFAHFAFTQGTVISNFNNHGDSLMRHETLHVWQSLGFGPIFQGTYVTWLIVGFFVSLILGLFVLGQQGMGRSIMDVAYLDNPWEYWAYSVGGAANGGVLSYT